MVTKSQTGRGWYEASRGSNNQRRFLKDDKDGKDKNSAALLAIRASPLDSAHQTDVTIRQSHDRIRQWKHNGNSCSELKPADPQNTVIRFSPHHQAFWGIHSLRFFFASLFLRSDKEQGSRMNLASPGTLLYIMRSRSRHPRPLRQDSRCLGRQRSTAHRCLASQR